jgi:hypothetical protein
MIMQIVTLFRPVGPKELELIKASDFKAFPPRLPAANLLSSHQSCLRKADCAGLECEGERGGGT